MFNKKNVIVLSVLSLLIITSAHAQLFPSSGDNSGLYYKIGGGQSVPMPPVNNNNTIPINAEGDVGLGFSCGKFNPMWTITQSLNNFKDSVENVPESITQNATSAIISFPMYKLAQADPKLYNILNNNVIGAHDQFALNMKSCNTMQTEALKGRDPYNSWITYSRNNDMKNVMSGGDGDLNTAMKKVNSDQGDNGVPWATPGRAVGANAGGVGQPPIMVIHDTSVAGYNVMLNRSVTATGAPSKSDDNKNLLNYWASPDQAAKWITSVVGDQKVTTCTNMSCLKDSTPGIGLLPYVQKATTDIQKKISESRFKS